MAMKVKLIANTYLMLIMSHSWSKNFIYSNVLL